MATYLMLTHFTDQGIRNVKDTVKRSEAMKATAAKFDIKVKDIYWTLGEFDSVAIVDAPDEAAVTALGLGLGTLGNVHTETLRAFTPDEMGKILAKLA